MPGGDGSGDQISEMVLAVVPVLDDREGEVGLQLRTEQLRGENERGSLARVRRVGINGPPHLGPTNDADQTCALDSRPEKVAPQLPPEQSRCSDVRILSLQRLQPVDERRHIRSSVVVGRLSAVKDIAEIPVEQIGVAIVAVEPDFILRRPADVGFVVARGAKQDDQHAKRLVAAAVPTVPP